MDKGNKISIPVRQVKKLPKRAILNEIIFNKADGYFYMGVKEEKEVKLGSRLEETSV